MTTPPGGQSGRDTVLMRVSVPVWTRIAERREQLRAERGRRSVSMTEALEDRLKRLEELEALLGQRDTHPAERERSE